RRPDGEPPLLLARLRQQAGEEGGEGAELSGIAEEGGLADGDQRKEPLELLLPFVEGAQVSTDVGFLLVAQAIGERRAQEVVPLGPHLEAHALPQEVGQRGDVLVGDPHHRTASWIASAIAPSGSTRSAAPSSIAA